MLYDTLQYQNGELLFKGEKLSRRAQKYGTPLMVMDTDGIRETLRAYQSAVRTVSPCGGIYYASKAFSAKAIYRLCEQEGAGIDVVSGGEVYTAVAAGFPMERYPGYSGFMQLLMFYAARH